MGALSGLAAAGEKGATVDRRPWGLLYMASPLQRLSFSRSQILPGPTFAEGLAPPPQPPGTFGEDAEPLLGTGLSGDLGIQGLLALCSSLLESSQRLVCISARQCLENRSLEVYS